MKNCVREMRTGKGWTQEQFAIAVGLTRQSVIAIEKGRFTPSIQTALRLARALGTTADHLFWLTGDKNDGVES
ncbi:MAG: transcriptional regulator [Chloroflexi bacterium RBG_19FT_COMBO_62_14]|nr:MAG: transcriptional regulator [Chloroflexi bacterium RBG_19FT_COMBO_62_14]